MNQSLKSKRDKTISEFARITKSLDWSSKQIKESTDSYVEGFNDAIQAVIELLGEFSEHDAYYRLGYDSEKEPGVKFIIEGARGQHAQILDKLRGES
jgi:hypothetical protein